MWCSKRTGRWLTAAALLGLLAGGVPAAEPPVLPDSLGQWYKPANKRQVWLHTMFSLRRELQAVREYAQAGDDGRLAKWSSRLAEHYRSLPTMVPEWRDEVDTTLIDDIERQVAVADHAAVARAADRLERDCRACHRQYQALAAVRHRWPRFDTLRIGERAYPDHMALLSDLLNRVKIASEDDRWDAARIALADLRGQLDALGDSCQACHDDPMPRERILGPSTAATLARLEQALADTDARSAGRSLGEAAVQTCARCHGVHRLLSGVQHQLFDLPPPVTTPHKE